MNIYSSSLEDHPHHRAFLSYLPNACFYLNYSKFVFAQETIGYLGHVISFNGVASSQSKISTIVHRTMGQNLKQLRIFELNRILQKIC